MWTSLKISMCATTSFADLALNNRDNTLVSYIEEKFSLSEKIISAEESQQLFSKSSTESDLSCELKTKSENFSSSTDTITPMLSINQDTIRSLEYNISKTEKLSILNAILHSQIDSFRYYDLFKILREYLNESDNEVFEATLEIHEKCINSSWELSKDAFINLLEVLYLCYCTLECDIHVDKYPFKNAIRIMKLVLNMFNRIFFHVPRYGYHRLEKIIGNFVDLLFVNMSSKDFLTLTPLNLLACLDTDAKWCKMLVYGSYAREILFKCIKRNINLIKYFFITASDWMYEPYVPNKLKKKDFIPRTTVKYLTFVHSIFMCSYLCRFKSFYELFPVNIHETKTVINLNSFTLMFISLLKLKSKILPSHVSQCMIDCSVNLLQFHQPELMVQNVQNILESANNQTGKKHLLEIVKLLFDKESITHLLIDSIIYTRRSRAGLTQDGKLLRPRPNSVISSRNNVFTVLMEVLVNILKNNKNVNNFKRIVNIARAILGYHEFYLMFSSNYSALIEFMELLSLQYENKSYDLNNGDEIMLSLDELLFAIGSTPVGFQFLSNINEVFLRKAVLRLEKTNMAWYYMPWKCGMSFMIFSEYDMNLTSYHTKINIEILQMIREVMEFDYSNDQQLNDAQDKIFNCIDAFSCCPRGVNVLLNFDTSACLQSNENLIPELTFRDFIKKYALNLNYEYQLQYLALQCLHRMTKSINSRIQLICSLNYEEHLSKIHPCYTSANSEIILDECSILRIALLKRNFSLLDESPCRDKLSANRSTRKASANVTLSRKKPSELQKFLQETKHGLYDNNWLRQARKAFKASLSHNIKMSLLVELMEKSAKSIAKPTKIRKLLITDETAAVRLHCEDYKGIEIVLKFAIKNHILQQNSSNEENLTQIFKVIRTYCGHQNSEFFGFDCTLATIFIMCSGSVEKCLQIASYIVPLPVSVFIWPQVTSNFMQKRYMFGHLLEWLLYQEVPNVFSALSVYGISWWLTCKCHLDDCFLNSMDWMNICQWLCSAILYPPDNLIYFFTSVAFKSESKILQTTNENDLRNLLRVIFNAHQLEEHLLYIDYLSKKYHFFISSHFIG